MSLQEILITFLSMRLWSLHPKYLDSKGLVALWREALLAKHVLAGKTKGYTHHPQLLRFREVKDPLIAIDYYLYEVWCEAEKRGYTFDKKKIDWYESPRMINVSHGQIDHEYQHLLHKLQKRDPKRYDELKLFARIDAHPMFIIVDGGVEEWEKTSSVEGIIETYDE